MCVIRSHGGNYYLGSEKVWEIGDVAIALAKRRSGLLRNILN
jgi:hypothetical protein